MLNVQTNRKTYFGQTQLLLSSPSTSAILGQEHKITKNKNIENRYSRGIHNNYINNNEKLSVSSTVHNDSNKKSIKKENYNNNSKNNNINNINSLYYSTNQKFKPVSKSYSSSSFLWDNNKSTNSNSDTKPNKNRKKVSSDKRQAQQTWSYHVLPSLYSIYQKVDRYRIFIFITIIFVAMFNFFLIYTGCNSTRVIGIVKL